MRYYLMDNPPKPLQFDENCKSETASKPVVVERLNFNEGPTPVKAPVSQVTPLFSEVAHPQVKQAFALAKLHFSELTQLNSTRLEQRIRQLLPFQMDCLLNWGKSPLEAFGTIAVTQARTLHIFATSSANELIAEVLELAKPQPKTLAARLFHRNRNPLEFKPKLLSLKQQLAPVKESCRLGIPELAALTLKLSLDLAALSVSLETVSSGISAELHNLASQRLDLLRAGLQQAKMLALQLEEVQKQVYDQLMRIDQLLGVTLPALILAQAEIRYT